MKIGNFKFGNDYKFDMKNVVRKEHEDIGKLNKIELRYNTRKNLPSYPAMKSLYRWRSVFGYRLGGILRQAVVKLAEVKRPFINAHNLVASTKDGGLHTYQRLYSSRDVMKAMKSTNPGSSQVKMLKYVSFGQMPERMHEHASGNDRSLRNKIMQKFQAISQNKETERFLHEQNKSIEKYNKNKPFEVTGGLSSNKFEDVPLHDVDAKMKEIKNQKSDFKIRWENNKERIAFKAKNQAERLGKFFGDWKDLGIKEAYSRLVDRSKRDEEHYQSQFNYKNTSSQGNDKPVVKSDNYYIGLYGEKVLKEPKANSNSENRIQQARVNLAEEKNTALKKLEQAKGNLENNINKQKEIENKIIEDKILLDNPEKLGEANITFEGWLRLNDLNNSKEKEIDALKSDQKYLEDIIQENNELIIDIDAKLENSFRREQETDKLREKIAKNELSSEELKNELLDPKNNLYPEHLEILMEDDEDLRRKLQVKRRALGMSPLSGYDDPIKTNEMDI